MRITPINNFYKNSLNSSLLEEKKSSNEKSSSEFCYYSAINAPSFKNIPWNMLSTSYTQPEKISEWVMNLVPEYKQLGEKIASFDFGVHTSEKIYRKFMNTKVDLSDSVAYLRNQIVEQDYKYVLKSWSLKEDKKENANNYIREHLDMIMGAIPILGAETIAWALNMKQQRFEKFLKDVEMYVNTSPNSYLELLKMMTNPIMTQYYGYLDNERKSIQLKMQGDENKEFFELHQKNKLMLEVLRQQVKESKELKDTASVKQLYAEISKIRRQEFEVKSDDFKELEHEMTRVKAEINKLLSDSIKDPQKKIELFYLYKGMPEKEDLLMLNKLMMDKTKDGDLAYKNFLIKKLSDLYKLSSPQERVINELNLQESPYFTRLFEAAPRKATYAYGVEVQGPTSQDYFLRNFRTFLAVVADENKFYKTFKELLTISSEENILQEVFDSLPQNQETKRLFKEKNLNYDVWSTYDEARDCIRIDDRTLIRKVNMNEIKHSLFLGNMACCCTAVGSGSRSGSAPIYPMNKFVQAIELVVDGSVVGNTMCYLAAVDAKCYPRYNPDGSGELFIEDFGGRNKLALILDNMEVLKPYRYEQKYLDAFIEYAQKLANDIGGQDLAIYAGHRNSFIMDDYKKVNLYRMFILGSSGLHTMSLDSISNLSVINDTVTSDKNYYGEFFGIKP